MGEWWISTRVQPNKHGIFQNQPGKRQNGDLQTLQTKRPSGSSSAGRHHAGWRPIQPHSLVQPAGTVTLCCVRKQQTGSWAGTSFVLEHFPSKVRCQSSNFGLALKRAIPVVFMLGRFVTSRPHRETHFSPFGELKLTFVPFYWVLNASSICNTSSPAWS